MFKSIFYSKTAEAAATWLAIGTVAITALVWLTPAWFGQLTWSQLILVGFSLSVVALLIIAASMALLATAVRKIWPIPASSPDTELLEELGRTKERLKRAEERLDGAQVAAGVVQASNKRQPRLTDADRERCAIAIRDINDWLGDIQKEVYTPLVMAVCGRELLLSSVEAVEPFRQKLDSRGSGLWHSHSHYLDLLQVDIMPVLRDLGELRNPIAGAAEAKDWPSGAQKERANALNTGFSNLGVAMNGLREMLSAKRQEFLDA